MQKKILRIVTKSDYFDITQSLFKEHNILKLFDINKPQIGIFMYKQLNSGDITLQQLHHNYPTHARKHLCTPQHSLTIFKHSLSYSSTIILNSVPEKIKTLPTLHSFKKRFKKTFTPAILNPCNVKINSKHITVKYFFACMCM